MRNRLKSKGERLGWQKLKDAAPVRLTEENLKGRIISKEELISVTGIRNILVH